MFNSEIFTIYLKTTPENIYERIKKDTTRPLLQVQDPKSELEKINVDLREEFEDIESRLDNLENTTP